METYEERILRQRAEKLDKERANLKTVQEVAAILGGTVAAPIYDADEWIIGYNNCFKINMEGQKCLHLGFETYGRKDRICISGEYPRDTRKQAQAITVATSKTPEQITKDITRRFMPEYETTLAVALQDQAERDAYNNRTEQYKDQLCSVPGVTRNTYNEGLSVRFKGAYGSIKWVSGDGTGNIELSSLPISKLLKILEVLNND